MTSEEISASDRFLSRAADILDLAKRHPHARAIYLDLAADQLREAAAAAKREAENVQA